MALGLPLSRLYCIAVWNRLIRYHPRTCPMHEPLPRGGLIRKLWISEADQYRDHLLRLDPTSRRNRFAGAVSDQFVRDYADLSFGIDALIHGFFVDGTPARRGGTAPDRRAGDARGRGGILDREAMAEPRRRLHAARGTQSRP